MEVKIETAIVAMHTTMLLKSFRGGEEEKDG